MSHKHAVISHKPYKIETKLVCNSNRNLYLVLFPQTLCCVKRLTIAVYLLCVCTEKQPSAGDNEYETESESERSVFPLGHIGV